MFDDANSTREDLGIDPSLVMHRQGLLIDPDCEIVEISKLAPGFLMVLTGKVDVSRAASGRFRADPLRPHGQSHGNMF